MFFFLIFICLFLDPFPIKSVLKRSKSFGTQESCNTNRTVTPEYFNYELLDNNDEHGNTQQILERVRSIFYQVLETQEFTQKLANFCCKVYQNCLSGVYFMDSLLCCAREWILEKNHLKNERWTRLVHFLSHLYQNLAFESVERTRRIHESSKSSSSDSENEELIQVFRNSSFWNSSENLDRRRQIKVLSSLLLDCISLSMKSTSNGEQELGASALRCFGDSLEKLNSSKMKQIVNNMRNDLLECRNDNKILLEMIELSSSDWNFEAQQEIYYFPFTKF